MAAPTIVLEVIQSPSALPYSAVRVRMKVSMTATIETSTSTTFEWVASASGTGEYYLKLTAGGDPKPSLTAGTIIGGIRALLNTASSKFMRADEGTLGSLEIGQYAYGDNDTLGYDTIYVRMLDSLIPGDQAVQVFWDECDTGDSSRWEKNRSEWYLDQTDAGTASALTGHGTGWTEPLRYTTDPRDSSTVDIVGTAPTATAGSPVTGPNWMSCLPAGSYRLVNKAWNASDESTETAATFTVAAETRTEYTVHHGGGADYTSIYAAVVTAGRTLVKVLDGHIETYAGEVTLGNDTLVYWERGAGARPVFNGDTTAANNNAAFRFTGNGGTVVGIDAYCQINTNSGIAFEGFRARNMAVIDCRGYGTETSVSMASANTTISFSGYVISKTTAFSSTPKIGENITISGSTSNDGTYEVMYATSTRVVVNAPLVTETAGAAITIDRTGELSWANFFNMSNISSTNANRGSGGLVQNCTSGQMDNYFVSGQSSEHAEVDVVVIGNDLGPSETESTIRQTNVGVRWNLLFNVLRERSKDNARHVWGEMFNMHGNHIIDGAVRIGSTSAEANCAQRGRFEANLCEKPVYATSSLSSLAIQDAVDGIFACNNVIIIEARDAGVQAVTADGLKQGISNASAPGLDNLYSSFNATVSFTAGTKTIARGTGNWTTLPVAGEKFVVVDSGSNDGIYTVDSATVNTIVTVEALVNESAGATVFMERIDETVKAGYRLFKDVVAVHNTIVQGNAASAIGGPGSSSPHYITGEQEISKNLCIGGAVTTYRSLTTTTDNSENLVGSLDASYRYSGAPTTTRHGGVPYDFWGKRRAATTLRGAVAAVDEAGAGGGASPVSPLEVRRGRMPARRGLGWRSVRD